MRNSKRKWYLILVVMSLFFSLNQQVFASEVNGQTGTDIGIGFEKTDANKPIVPPLNPNKPQPTLPNTNSQRLPQLGEFIEPMLVILLGLIIWLTGLSILALRKYLNKESKV